MIRCVLLCVMVIGLSASASGQDKPARRGLPPELMIAQARERDGKVVVSLTAYFAATKVVEVVVDGRKEVVTAPTLAWTELELVLDGKVLKAVGQDNQPLNGNAVLKRLEKSTAVAVYRYGDEDLGLAKAFRDGTVVLKGDWQDWIKNNLLQAKPGPGAGAVPKPSPVVPKKP